MEEYRERRNHYYTYQENGKWGIRHNRHHMGKIVVPCQYDEVIFSSSSRDIDDEEIWYFAFVRQGDKWGYVGGAEHIGPCLYDELEKISENCIIDYSVDSHPLLKARQGDKWGVLHGKKEIVPCSYDEVVALGSTRRFAEDPLLYFVGVRRGDKWGVVNEKGKEIYPCQYDAVEPTLNPDYYRVCLDGKWGLVEKESAPVVVPCHYDEIVMDDPYGGCFHVRQGDKWGVLGTFGGDIPCKYDGATGWNISWGGVCKNGKWGVISNKEEELIPFRYDGVRFCCDHLFIVHVQRSGKWGLWGLFYYKKSGKIGRREIVPCKYDEINSRGYRCRWGLLQRAKSHLVKSGDKWGVVNDEGEEIVPCRYDALKKLGGYDYIVCSDNAWGLINFKGEELIPCMYEEIDTFPGEIVSGMSSLSEPNLFVVRQGGRWGVVDRNGETFIPCQYDRIEEEPDNSSGFGIWSDGIWVWSDGKMGLFNKKGKEILPCQYDRIEDYYKRPIFIGQRLTLAGFGVRQGDKWGIVGKTGKVVVPCLYDEIDDRDAGFFVCQGDKWGVRSKKGEEIAPCKYDEIRSLRRCADVEEDRTIFDPYAVSFGNKWGIIAADGQEIIPCRYDTFEELKRSHKLE